MALLYSEMIQYTEFHIKCTHLSERLNLVDTEMHTLKMVAYLSNSDSEFMSYLVSLIHCMWVGESKGWAVLEEEQSRRL